jgi:hypothetical protein
LELVDQNNAAEAAAGAGTGTGTFAAVRFAAFNIPDISPRFVSIFLMRPGRLLLAPVLGISIL